MGKFRDPWLDQPQAVCRRMFGLEPAGQMSEESREPGQRAKVAAVAWLLEALGEAGRAEVAKEIGFSVLEMEGMQLLFELELKKLTAL